MEMSKFKTVFLDEARDFILSLPEQPKSKIVYNIRKVEGGFMSSDLFKKLDGSDIWEFRTLYNGIQYRLFAFWDTEEDTLFHSSKLAISFQESLSVLLYAFTSFP